MNKKAIVPALVLGVATTVGALSYVSATNASNGNMASDLAEKLGVEQSQVDSAMDDIRGERQVEMKEKQEEKLAQAVEDGVITEDQKSALISHREEMQQKREQLRQEDETWCEENGIDRDALREYTGGGMGKGGAGGGHGMWE